jgi:hypothetical protein
MTPNLPRRRCDGGRFGTDGWRSRETEEVIHDTAATAAARTRDRRARTGDAEFALRRGCGSDCSGLGLVLVALLLDLHRRHVREHLGAYRVVPEEREVLDGALRTERGRTIPVMAEGSVQPAADVEVRRSAGGPGLGFPRGKAL